MSCHSSLLAFLLFFFLFLLFPPRPFSSFLPSVSSLLPCSSVRQPVSLRISRGYTCFRCRARDALFHSAPHGSGSSSSDRYMYIYIPLLANLTDNSSLLHSPSTRSARLTFFPRSSSPLRYLLPCTPFIFQRARAIGILTTEAALSSPRYPDPDGCEISRTRLARVQSNQLFPLKMFSMVFGRETYNVHDFFPSFVYRHSRRIPRNPLSLVQFFRDSIVRIFDA